MQQHPLCMVLHLVCERGDSSLKNKGRLIYPAPLAPERTDKAMVKVSSRLSALLLASSPYHAKRDFTPAEAEAFRTVMGAGRQILFIPYALAAHEAYGAFYERMMPAYGCSVRVLPAQAPQDEKLAMLTQADALFVGGGNTFRLLSCLQGYGLFDVLRARIADGMPYLGTSAGSTLFCPTIQTTNDMPIVPVADMRAFGFLPFQINPHFPHQEGQGAAESRRDRLHEYHEENETPVLGLREGGGLLLRDGTLSLVGPSPAALFRKGHPDAEITDVALLALKQSKG